MKPSEWLISLALEVVTSRNEMRELEDHLGKSNHQWHKTLEQYIENEIIKKSCEIQLDRGIEEIPNDGKDVIVPF